MICPPCKDAGQALVDGRGQVTAFMLHNECLGGTWCDCQHDLTRNMIRRENSNVATDNRSN